MESTLLFKARSNTLLLGDRNRFSGGEVICEMCRLETEDLGHFILRCPELSGARKGGLIWEVGGQEDRERLGRLLFTGGRVEEAREMLGNLWRLRSYLVARNRRELGMDMG